MSSPPKAVEDLKHTSVSTSDLKVATGSPATAGKQTAHTSVGGKKAKKYLDEGVAIEDVLKEFYGVYAPSKVEDVPNVLQHFDGRESDLFHTLELKYNVTFMTDGTCTPNDAAAIGEPFIENSKFAVDVSKYTLRERLRNKGINAEKVAVVLSSGSEMM
jgi:hypothetical protein